MNHFGNQLRNGLMNPKSLHIWPLTHQFGVWIGGRLLWPPCCDRAGIFLFVVVTFVMLLFVCLSQLIQAMTFVVYRKSDLPVGEEYVSRSLTLDWSFGMCLTSDLSPLHRLAWAYVTPVYLLLLIGLSYFLSHFRCLVKVFGRYSVIRMFWQFILLSFSSLATTSFQLLKCVTLSPRKVFEHVHGPNSHNRFAYDASIQCFAGDHLPWAIFASVVVGLICVPLPMFLPTLHRSPRFKPLYDVYASMYQDNFRWWASYDLVRRLIFAAIYTAESDPDKQQMAFILVCLTLLAIHAIVWPFKSWVCNCVETLFLLALAFIATLSGPGVTWTRAVVIQILFFLPIATLLVGWIAVRVSKRDQMKFQGMKELARDLQSSLRSRKLTLDRFQSSSNTYGLRDSLLAEPEEGQQTTFWHLTWRYRKRDVLFCWNWIPFMTFFLPY